MKFGVCRGGDGIETAAKYGFLYIEPPLAALRDKSDEELLRLKQKAGAHGVGIDGFNCFFGSGVSLYGDGFDAVMKYAEKNFDTAVKLGASYCVIGSGAARRVPAGMEKREAEERFACLLDGIGALGAKHGIGVILEPLRRAETDLINTLPEGLRMCRMINNENVGCLVDFFHFYMNGEELSELDGIKPGELRHVHLARPDADRRIPQREDKITVGEWLKKLSQIGYDGRISLECTWGRDFDGELASAASVIKELL